MRKKLWFAVAMLLLSTLMALQVIEVAVANPVPYPTTPNQDKPTLTIESPQNYTAYNGTEVYLNFTVTKPDSWVTITYMGLQIPNIGEIQSVNAYLDGTAVNLTYSYTELGRYSVNINQSAPGLHTLNVTVLSYTYYKAVTYGAPNSRNSYTTSTGPVHKHPIVVSDTVSFTVVQPAESTHPPFVDSRGVQNQILLVAIICAVIAVVALSLAYAQRRLNHK